MDGGHGHISPDSILIEQQAERREYVLEDDARPSRSRTSYRDEARVYPRDDRYSLAQDDRYEGRGRGREDRRVVVEDDLEIARSRCSGDQTVGKHYYHRTTVRMKE